MPSIIGQRRLDGFGGNQVRLGRALHVLPRRLPVADDSPYGDATTLDPPIGPPAAVGVGFEPALDQCLLRVHIIISSIHHTPCTSSITTRGLTVQGEAA